MWAPTGTVRKLSLYPSELGEAPRKVLEVSGTKGILYTISSRSVVDSGETLESLGHRGESSTVTTLPSDCIVFSPRQDISVKLLSSRLSDPTRRFDFGVELGLRICFPSTYSLPSARLAE